MTIEQTKEDRRQMESKISRLLFQFCKDHPGVEVTEINVQPFELGSGIVDYNVNVQTRL